MKKYANYEHKRITFSLVAYLILDVTAYTLEIVLFTVEYLGQYNTPLDMYNKKFFKFLRIFFLTNVPQMMVGYAIIRLKDYNDPIQYISRLDNTLKVSIFQRWIQRGEQRKIVDSADKDWDSIDSHEDMLRVRKKQK